MATFKTTKKHHKHLNNPFPSQPPALPFIQGNLLSNSYTLPFHQLFPIGKDFQLLWSTKNGGFVSISHKSTPSTSLWSTIPGKGFVAAALADTEVEESRGSFVIKDKIVHLGCDQQTIDDIRVINRADQHPSRDYKIRLKGAKFPVVVITGQLCSTSGKKRGIQDLGIYKRMLMSDKKKRSFISARYWLLFEQENSNQVGFHVEVEKPNIEFKRKASKMTHLGRYRRLRKKLGRARKWKLGWFRLVIGSRELPSEDEMRLKDSEFNRVCLTYSSQANERFYGFGEQFSHMDFKGKRVPIFVQEQGIGRGDQPITFAANLVSYRSGGDWSTTYAPSPFYMTSKLRSLYLEGYDYSIFDLTKDDRVQIQTYNNSLKGRILHGHSPCELIEHFTETIGRPPQLPKWIISGAVVGMQGGTETVRRVWDQLAAYKVPISAFWLQDWVGQRKTVIGSQLWWNWEVDSTRYNGWKELVKDLGKQQIKVMTYCNPCLAPINEKPNRRRNLFDEAKKLDILVKDEEGKPYMVANTAFDVGMLDFTHPDTARWFKQVLQEMVDDGVRGWMADFGEGLPVDCTLYSGEDSISAHNRYPELWAQINREFVEEWKLKQVGKENAETEEDLVFFMRAGFRESPKWGMLFWEGDQMVSWQANDGIKSAVVGLLSSGISGYALNHSDIGGYCSVNLPFIKYRRSEELLMRWTELNAFTTVFRTHEGNKPSINSQFYTNEKTLSQFARCARIYEAWYFYRIQLVKEATEKGLPVCRHLFLHYPDDDHVHNLTYQQFLLGTEILVVPVLDKGKNKVKAYFPIGERCPWQHIWSGEVFAYQGCEAWIKAPVGYPAVFVKAGSKVGETFLRNLIQFNILQ